MNKATIDLAIAHIVFEPLARHRFRMKTIPLAATLSALTGTGCRALAGRRYLDAWGLIVPSVVLG